MPRPRKNATAKAEPKQETLAVEKPVDDGLVALNHFCREGRMVIDNVTYDIVNGVVRVKPEHADKAREHIKLGG